MGPRRLNFSISACSLITWPIELKLRRMILDIGARSHSVGDFEIAFHGARLSKPSISIIYNSIITWPTELEFCRLILAVSAHSHFSAGAPLEIFKSIPSLQ